MLCKPQPRQIHHGHQTPEIQLRRLAESFLWAATPTIFLCLFPCPHPFHLNLQINVSAWKSPHHHPPKSASHLHVSGKRPGSSNLRTLSTPNRHHGIRNPIFFWELSTRNFVKLLSCLSFFIFYFDFFMSSLSFDGACKGSDATHQATSLHFRGFKQHRGVSKRLQQ